MVENRQEMELLFFETFSHESAEELNLDLVQFPRPVVIEEVRVIPLQTRVQADVPGGVRLGATNPANFKLELFVNNLSKPNASTFEKLGLMEYKANEDIQLRTNVQIPTDGLILKGWYNTLTIAIYGELTSVSVQTESLPPPPPPQPKKLVASVPQGSQTPGVKIEPTSSTPLSIKIEPKVEPKEWDATSQMLAQPPVVIATPHTTQHPLDYIQEQLNQANLQSSTMTITPSLQPHPIVLVAPTGLPPGQMSLGLAQPIQDYPRPGEFPRHPADTDRFSPDGHGGRERYDDGRERTDSWNYHDQDRRSRDYPTSREGSRDRDREYRGDYRDDRDRERDWDRDKRDRGSRDRDSKERYDDRGDRGRGYDERRDRDFDRGDRDRDSNRDRNFERDQRDREMNIERERGRDYDRDQGREEGYREGERERELELEPQTIRVIGRDIREAGFRDRTRDDFRDMSRDVFMETEAPRSPSIGSRSRSFSGDRFSSRSRSASPNKARSRSISPDRVDHVSAGREIYRVKDSLPEQPLSPSPDQDINEEREAETFEQLSVEQVGSPVEQGYMSDGDYEAISSEDELIDIDTELGIDYEMEEEAFSYITSPFNPYQFEATSLTTFKDISQTKFEQEKASLLHPDYVRPDKCPKEAQQLLDIVDRFKEGPLHDSWVEAMESVPSLLPKGLSYLLYVEPNPGALDYLLDWAMEGLNEARAMAQPESTYKVRHLKMGFKLAGALCCCDSNVAVKCLERGVQERLLDNFESKFMSFSLKLQIAAALHHSTRLQDGLEWFLGTHKLQGEQSGQRSLSNYQRTVMVLLQKKQVVRVIVAMTTLIKKVHLYEVMNKLALPLENAIESLSGTQVGGESQSESNQGDSAQGDSSQVEGSQGDGNQGDTVEQVDVCLGESDLEAISTCVEEVTKVYTLANTLIAQPPRTLPGQKMVEIKQSPEDPYPGFYHMANACQLLESLLVIVSSPTMCCMPTLFGAVRSLVQRIMGEQHGLVYLASRPDTTNKIIQALIQITDSEDVSEENVAQQLGVEMIYYLQALGLIDKLAAYHQLPEKNLAEDAEPVTLLHMMFTMTFTPLGHAAVVHTLTQADNISVLMPFVKLSGDDREDAKLRKSVSAGYSTELLNIVVHYSDSVEFLQRHSKHLLAIGEQEFSSKLARLKEWLLPLKSLTIFSHNGLPAIIEQLMVLKNDVLKLPRGLITVLRILKNLAVAPQNDFPEDKNEEMKYKYVLVELFSADCLPVFVTILQKLSELMLRPWQKGVPKSSETLSLYLFIMKPCLEMAKAITQYLIMARGTEFRDLTGLATMFELHTVLCSVPTISIFAPEINSIQREIVDTIASYTQPLSQPSQEKDKISESLWTLAIRDLLKFTMKAPYTYLSGLQMLSELLPLPLPLQTKEPLTTEEVQLAINTRKLWSAHLLPLHTTLHGIVRTLATTSCQPLQQILRKICFQMSDLASPTASMITQCILDILLEHIESIGNLEKGGDRPGAQSAADKPQEPRPAPSPEDYKVVLATLGRFLNLLAYLLSQPAIKCTMLRIIGSDGEDKYQSVLPRMLDILNTVCDRPEHIQDQESIVSILQSLCDLEVTLLAGDSNVSIPEQVVNALPCVPQLTQIIEALFVHIAHPSHKYESVLPCIRALVMLTEYNYSFYILKITFEKHKSAVYRLLQRIKIKFSKDSSDTLSTFSTTLEFLRLLVCTDMPDTRSITLTNQELREVVGWNKDVTNHPLIDLQKLLDESLKEEEALDSLLESVNSLLAVLRAESPQKQKPDVSPPVVPEPLSLHTLFNTRSVYTVTDADDDRLTTTFWQTTFEADVPDLVPYDLEAICLKYCRDFNIEEELKRDTGLPSDEELTKPKKLKDRRKSQEFVTWRGRGVRRPFVAPMRGRGIARGLAAQANRHDNFRNRPPNTSRPPSMHVDDFMKLEQKSEQNTSGPDNRDNNFIHNRGRGGFERGRGSFDRGRGGRFFTPPGSFRRDVNTRGGQEGESSMYRSKAPFGSSPRFGNNGHDRPMSGERRDSRGGGRFEPRGRSSWRGGNWTGSRFKDDRFGGNNMGGFRGHGDPGRHQRSFTK
ncbi:protein virilizer homolog [Mya arenaria]|uniref:protein virilizer homolog n=1 Tax=Mya arenaria TaxID=6604 RepID=UPI0022E529FE|nr:protein virilizer homolog [Mya arenaria]